ncbi:hypothetical protein BC828DRAFT_372332 [Blastocladiella britannica]|nr:hypothetical protein BC828DRAFT_372332 [Blastocladiella britannica]
MLPPLLTVNDCSQRPVPSPAGFAPIAPPKNGGRFGVAKQSTGKKDLTEQTRKAQLLEKKAWDIAYSGVKSMPMNLFMMYMSGNSLQIFTILITVMMFWNPIKSLMSLDKAFDPIARSGSVQLFMPKAMFIAVNIGNMMIAMYKCAQMGLLPTSDSDWLAFAPGIPRTVPVPGELLW